MRPRSRLAAGAPTRLARRARRRRRPGRRTSRCRRMCVPCSRCAHPCRAAANTQVPVAFLQVLHCCRARARALAAGPSTQKFDPHSVSFAHVAPFGFLPVVHSRRLVQKLGAAHAVAGEGVGPAGQNPGALSVARGRAGVARRRCTGLRSRRRRRRSSTRTRWPPRTRAPFGFLPDWQTPARRSTCRCRCRRPSRSGPARRRWS